MNGVWRKSFFATPESAFAESAKRLVDSIAPEVLLRAASAACLIGLDMSAMRMLRKGGVYQATADQLGS